MAIYTGVNKIAIGHTNITGLTSWDRLKPPLFKGFNFVNTDWRDFTERMNADRRFGDFGKQSVVLIFEKLDDCEVRYLMDTFFGSGDNRDCLVTIKAQNRNTRNWHYFNGTMKRPSIGATMEDSLSGPNNVRLEILDLVKII